MGEREEDSPYLAGLGRRQQVHLTWRSTKSSWRNPGGMPDCGGRTAADSHLSTRRPYWVIIALQLRAQQKTRNQGRLARDSVMTGQSTTRLVCREKKKRIKTGIQKARQRHPIAEISSRSLTALQTEGTMVARGGDDARFVP